MSEQVKIVPYSEQYAESLSAFTNRYWPNRKRKYDDAYLRWKFRGPEKGKLDSFLLAILDDEVVGQLGAIPARIRIKDEVIPCQWVCEFMVDSNRRGFGIGTKLVNAFADRGIITLGSNPTTASNVVHTKVGFIHLDGPYNMFLPIKAGYLLDLKLPNMLKKTIPALEIIANPYVSFRARHITKQHILIETVHWSKALTLIKHREQQLEIPHIVHDEQFLSWRCTGIENFKPNITAVIINEEAYAIVEFTSGISMIYEWYASNVDDVTALFSIIYNTANHNNSHTLKAFANSKQEYQSLKNIGFIATRTKVDIIAYPKNRFLPMYSRFHYRIYDSDGNI